ncbi:MAG: carboxypeptidase regulatory-like domain-containing protein [Anaerolineae bacterium]|nr:carboxypeptidase regulatory-like domain-containing protein [Anaerolineae bacterium]
MKSKHLFQIFVLFVLLLSTFGSSQPVKAQTNDPIIITRNLSIWDATFIGFVSSGIYEQWHVEFTESHNFTVTVNTVAGDLVPLLILQDSNGSELTRGTGSLTSTQPAGNYSIQVQPESGSGFYVLTIRENIITPPPSASVTTSVTPSSVNVGESAVVTVSLNNVPADGYTSAEFTCTYDASLVAVSNIVAAGLFGADPATAFNSSQNGSFIFAIAGSNGNKATTSGTAFTFSVTGLQAGQTAIECTARVSKGDNVLTTLPSTGTSLTVTGTAPTSTATQTAAPSETATQTPDGSATATATQTPDGSETATSTPDGSATATSTPDGSETATSTPDGSETATATQTPDGTVTATSTPDGSETATSTPVESPTPTATALPDGTLNGQVLASKPVTVSLYDGLNLLVTSVTTNVDGTFSLTAPAGTYTVRATADGFLSAEGSATLTGGSTTTMPTISLLAGDIDNNDVIDQFDAMTIGMNYNTSTPAAADLNNDGVINVLDLEVLASNYRETGPTVWE